MIENRPELPGDSLFDQRNGFLDFLLGIISVSERVVATVADLAEPDSPPPPRKLERAPIPDGPVLR